MKLEECILSKYKNNDEIHSRDALSELVLPTSKMVMY